MYHPPRPAPIIAPRIESRDYFKALTPDRAKLWIEEGRQFSYMCLGDQDYLTLGQYFSEVRRWIDQANRNFDYYEAQE